MRQFAVNAIDRIPDPVREFAARRIAEAVGALLVACAIATGLALATWSTHDPSFNYASNEPVRNLLGVPGAIVADSLMQMTGLGAITFLFPLGVWGWRLMSTHALDRFGLRAGCWLAGTILACAFVTLLPTTDRWPLPTGLGGVIGDAFIGLPRLLFGPSKILTICAGLICGITAVLALSAAARSSFSDPNSDADRADDIPAVKKPARQKAEDSDSDASGEPGWAIVAAGAVLHGFLSLKSAIFRRRERRGAEMREPGLDWPQPAYQPASRAAAPQDEYGEVSAAAPARREPDIQTAAVVQPAAPPRPAIVAADHADASPRVTLPSPAIKTGKRATREAQPSLLDGPHYQLPPLLLLSEPKRTNASKISIDGLEQNARLLEGVLDDFGVKGEIINVRPGPVVTLYELEPAPGIKSSRVIGLADDIARSMSAISARVAVVQGRNAIGIELPNQLRETVFLRELLASEDFERSKLKLAIAMGKTIGGEPVIVDLARMPHLLVAGTTGSGKSVAINTMILSLLYRLKPEECKLIMIDPKMLELSVYDGIPHLLTPVVTDPKKAVVALKWAVREMENRYKKMSKIGVRNIDGFNVRVGEAKAKGETIKRTVQTGYDKETGEAVFENEELDLSILPYIVVIVDEMADLMMVAGKDIEGAIQRLAQMARAAGIHLIMATQRPSVDVITGTIKANFPTRVSFQVTSKIDSRTILGEQGAEQLLGQGDMLYMAGGGRISRVHGPFVSDTEMEKIVAHLKTQGQPQYLEAITMDDEELGEDAGHDLPGSMDSEEGLDLYDRAVAIVLRDRKCSTSYIQRRLSVGYNKAASLVERMEKEGLVSPSNHSGKREILVGGGIDRGAFDPGPDDGR